VLVLLSASMCALRVPRTRADSDGESTRFVPLHDITARRRWELVPEAKWCNMESNAEKCKELAERYANMTVDMFATDTPVDSQDKGPHCGEFVRSVADINANHPSVDFYMPVRVCALRSAGPLVPTPFAFAHPAV
jgi:hypothetical protein